MRLLLVALVGLAISQAVLAIIAKPHLFNDDIYQDQFTTFISSYDKHYKHDELFFRYQVFKNNVDFISQHNALNRSYTVAMNQFGDLTAEEFHITRTGYNHIDKSFLRARNAPVVHPELQDKKTPAAIDWRQQNAVTPVKDQGQCGSCWAFSSTGSLEGAWAVAKKQLVSLSEQQLMDCSTAQGNQGCNGGEMDQAFQYVITNKGLTTEANYPYTGADGTCMSPLPTPAVTISSFADVTVNSDSALQTAVALGPVSVAIEADKMSFQFYQSGVYSDADCGDQLDHGVLVVGYGTLSNQNYWIVKNSWGATWGQSGYILLLRKDGEGQCGINMSPSYPIV